MVTISYDNWLHTFVIKVAGAGNIAQPAPKFQIEAQQYIGS